MSSLFTNSIVQGLETGAADRDKDGYISYTELYGYAYDNVKRITHLQKPQIWTFGVQGDIIIANNPKLEKPSATFEDISSIIDDGLQHKDNEEYESAIACFDQAIKINPNNHVPYRHKGDVLLKKEDYNGAIDAYKKAIVTNPKKNYETYYRKGYAYSKLRDYRQAIESYDEALKVKPKYFNVLKEKGLALYRLQDYAQAVKCYDEALKVKPNDQEVIDVRKEADLKLTEYVEFDRGVSDYELGKYEEAIECFDRSLKANSRNEQTLYYKGLALSRLSKYKEAIEYCFDEALRIRPTYNEAAKAKESAHEMQIQKEISSSLDQGLQYIKNNDYKSAIDVFDEVITLNPKNYVPYNYKGDALFKLEEYDEAIKYYDKALEIKPDYYYAWFNKGEVLSKKGEDIRSAGFKEFEECYNEAIKCYSKALEIKPQKAEAWFRKGHAIDILGKFEEAITSYDEALKIRSDYQDALKDKGLALSNLGKYQAAVECFDGVLSLIPKKVEIWYYKGLTLQKLGNYNDAIGSFEEALKIKPDYAIAFYNKGLSFSSLSNYEDAIKCFDKAIEIDPNNVDALFNKGKSFFSLGKHIEAIECFDKVIAIDRNNEGALNYRTLSLQSMKEVLSEKFVIESERPPSSISNTKMMTVMIDTAGIDAHEAQEWVNELTKVDSDMETEDVNVSGNKVSFKVGFSGMEDVDPRDIAARIEEYLRTNEAFKATNISISDGIQQYNFSQIDTGSINRHDENTALQRSHILSEELLKIEDGEVDFALACAIDESLPYFTHNGRTMVIVQSKDDAKSNKSSFENIEPFIEALISNILLYMVITKLENAEVAGKLSDVEIVVERGGKKFQVTLNNILFANDMSGIVTP